MCPFLQQHVVEIQLHHAKFISIRENLGGHFIYSIFRSLTEAVEVVFGKDEARRMITEAGSDVQETEHSLEAGSDVPSQEVQTLKVTLSNCGCNCTLVYFLAVCIVTHLSPHDEIHPPCGWLNSTQRRIWKQLE
jgi:hypothetical protein